MRNLPALINGAVMLAMLAGGAGMSAYVMLTPELRSAVGKPLPGYDYINGRITSTIEGSYKQELPVRSRAIDLLNAFTVALFNEGRKGVVVGDDGWLFTAEEYAWTQKSDGNLKTNLLYIAGVAAELSSHGISLEIGLVPEKADIYAGMLLRPRPAAHEGKYAAVRTALLSLTDARIPDLRTAMMGASRYEDVFFPTDTHWSVEGAGAVALALAGDFPSMHGVPEADFTLKPGPSVAHEGDLERFIELGPFGGLLPATADQVTPVVAVAQAGTVDDFLAGPAAAAGPEIALIGTSYSANPLWSFEPQLKSALRRDVLNLAEEGHGPMEPMEAFLKLLRGGSVSIKAVIWEVPIRYLDDDPKAALSGSPV